MKSKTLVFIVFAFSSLVLAGSFYYVFDSPFAQDKKPLDPLRQSIVCNYQGNDYVYGDNFSRKDITCGTEDMGIPYHSVGGGWGSRGNKDKCSCEGVSFFTDNPNVSDSKDFYYCTGELRNCSRFNLSEGNGN